MAKSDKKDGSKKDGPKKNGRKKDGGKKAKKTSGVEATIKQVFTDASHKAAELAQSPVVAEIVAASLVAAAAAIKNPAKARAMAASAADELKSVGKSATDKNNPFWQLALDIARRSIDSLGADVPAKGKGGGKKKS